MLVRASGQRVLQRLLHLLTAVCMSNVTLSA